MQLKKLGAMPAKLTLLWAPARLGPDLPPTVTFVIAPSLAVSYSFRVMYDDFQAIDRWTAQPLHCQYQALIVAIATRHADAVDIKFLVDDRPVWIALPHVAWVEFNRQTGKVITDPMAVQIAGHYLKWAIESGEDSGREMYSLTVQETLDHLNAIIEENQASAVARIVPVQRAFSFCARGVRNPLPNIISSYC